MEMIRRSGQQGVPVITLDEHTVVGFDRPRLEQILMQANVPGDAPASRPRFGAAIADASRITQRQGDFAAFGAYIGKVSPGSPAAQAGLQPGDIITELNLRPITNAASFQQAFAGLHAGDILEIGLRRGGRQVRARTAL